ncbi:MAG: hypothetical protein C0402_11545 [Thermodesulfovibrio sp.]|nr:hypothetical protein [Thermodesulfovibrio sp.]
MRNLIKNTAIWSLLIIAGLLTGCGSGDTEQFVKNQGDVRITVTNNQGAPLSGVQVQVRTVSGTGTYDNVGLTDANGQLTFTGDAGKDYFFTFSKAGLTSQIDILRTPILTATVTLNVTMN